MSHTISFLPGGQSMDLFSRTGKENPLYNPLVGKMNFMARWKKNINFISVIVALALIGDQTSHSQNKLFSPVAQYAIFLS